MSAPVGSTGCAMEGCVRPLKALGLCQTHYMRQRRHGDPHVSLITREHPDVCSVDGCDRPYRASGLCYMHWQRQRTTGDTGTVDPIRRRYGPDDKCSVSGCERRPQRHGLCEMHADRLDDSGAVGQAEPLKGPTGSGHTRKDGYIEVRCPLDHPLSRDGRTLLHRLILWGKLGDGPHKCHWCPRLVNWAYGLTDGALVVDHLDFDTTNNDPGNLVPSCFRCNVKRFP